MFCKLSSQILKEMFLSIDEIRNYTYYVNITIIWIELQYITTENQYSGDIIVHFLFADPLFSLGNV
jgi:hypothetical protein